MPGAPDPEPEVLEAELVVDEPPPALPDPFLEIARAGACLREAEAFLELVGRAGDAYFAAWLERFSPGSGNRSPN